MAEQKLVASEEDPATARIRSEVREWLSQNWDPELTVAEWWERLGESGWAAPQWPEEWYGRGLSRDVLGVVAEEIRAAGAVGPPGGLGVMLAGPTIIAHGTDDQKRRYLRDIITGKVAWCQLFSEPGAGSDLAGLQTKAVRDGDEWIITGQKVWTSGGHVSELGMLLARTDPSVPKHAGISYFAIEMDQPGVDVRPLREMTGAALFNEVFLDEARVSNDALIGGENNGWAVGLTTLANERIGLGAGGGGAAGGAAAGSKPGQLGRRVGDFAGRVREGGGPRRRQDQVGQLAELARKMGRIHEAPIRQNLMRLHSMNEIARYTTLRSKAAAAAGRRPGPETSTAKLAMTRITMLSRDLGLAILGPHGTLTGQSAPDGGMIAGMALFSPAVPIYGGSDEIQRNIVGERVLGLPGEPRVDKDVPFSELKVGTQRSAD